MPTRYLGPAIAGHHVDLFGQALDGCYLLQAGEDCGVSGAVIEGDVLVVDESRSPAHGDLVVAMLNGEREVFEAVRLGPRFRYRRVSGHETRRIRPELLRGVVVRLVRRYAG